MTFKNTDPEKLSEHVAGPIERILRDLGIPVPECFYETGAVVDPSRPARGPMPISRDARLDIPQRHARLLELKWPLRALNTARNAQDTPAIVRIREWSPRKSAIVLAGQKGCGKTVAAAWRALHWGRAATFRFVHAADLACIGRYSAEWKELLDAPALCIDDLGAEYSDVKESFLVDFENLINRFYANERPLIVTTNMTVRALGERYGGRVYDRMIECAQWENVDGPSLRLDESPPWEIDETTPWEES